jgi:hypothetical protein
MNELLDLEDWKPEIQTAIQIMAAQNLAKAIKGIIAQIKEDFENDLFDSEPAMHNSVVGYQQALEAALTASGVPCK